MGRALWTLALVGSFGLGVAVSPVVWPGRSAIPPQTVTRLEQQVSMLQARLRARESSQPSGVRAPAGAPHVFSSASPRSADRLAAAAVVADDPAVPERPGPGERATRGRTPGDGGSSRAGTPPTTGAAPTVEAALDRFYQYLETMQGPAGRERGQRLRELLDELRGMGEVGGQALMQVLATGSDSDERRTAARLLGTLQIPEALPLLRDVIQREDDVLLRRAAASGLRQLHTPESMSVMERIIANTGEDRFVRLSAAYGLAESGKPLGVAGLAQIFEESSADGRGRAVAFRALTSLNDERPLPFMRQLLTSEAEPSYRLQAIRYVTAQGDRQALGALQAVMQSGNEQASIRDAAAQAYRALSGR